MEQFPNLDPPGDQESQQQEQENTLKQFLEAWLGLSAWSILNS